MIITICNRKGGTGKSMTALNLGAALTDHGHRVLLIDLDSQGNLTDTIRQHDPDALTVADALKGKAIKKCIQNCLRFDLIQSDPEISIMDIYPDALKAVLKPISDDYEFILIDTAPEMNTALITALTASDGVIIPIQADVLSLNGVQILKDTIDEIRQTTNPKLKIYGLLLTRYRNYNFAKEIRNTAGTVAQIMGTKVFAQPIRERVALTEAQAHQTDIFKYQPRSDGAADYNALAEELIRDINDA